MTETTESTENSDEVILPPVEVLHSLLEFTQQGRLIKIREYLENLIQEDNRYLSFATPIIALTKQFDDEQIEKLLNQYLIEENSHG